MSSSEADRLVINPASIDEDHIHVVAGIVWNTENPSRFLIAQRQKGKHLQDYWEFPGGKMEADETPLQALCRELEEEINITPTRASPYMRVYCRYPERNVMLDTWVVDAYSGEVEAAEGQSLQWIGLDEVDCYRFPAADIPILEAIRNSVKAGTRCFP